MTEPGNANLLGQIAVQEGLLTSKQLEECLTMQVRSGRPSHLGEFLVREKYITQEQLDELVHIQSTRFRRLTGTSVRGGLLGQLALQHGYVSVDQLNECLREQQAKRENGSPIKLGEILLERGCLTSEQFLDLLRRQNRKIVHCQHCDTLYDLTTCTAGEKYQCSECEGVVEVPADPN